MNRVRLVWAACLALAMTGLSCVTPANSADTARKARPRTHLDRYVHAPDDAYTYTLAREMYESGVALYVLDLTSQVWRSPHEVDQTRWRHWLSIYVPDRVSHESAMLYIGSGDTGDPPPDRMSREFSQIARTTESVVAYLGMVPNQPLVFAGDGLSRTEDSLIAYTWDKFLRTGDENWPLRNPMTKSAVRAMDAIQEFCASELAGAHPIRDFVVTGASKRGWTTWLTAAVDARVRAIAPLVIDMLNVKASFRHHWEAYGSWAPAVGDYEAMGLMEWIGAPEYDRLLELVEPYSYADRYTMPKLIVNSCGDQFFLPDSSQFYWDDLPGEKYLRYVPNTGHELEDSDAIFTLLAFYHSIIAGIPLPQYAWDYGDGHTLTVTTSEEPVEVRFWTATNPATRDFRIDVVGKIWESEEVEPGPGGVYTARLRTPPHGWTAQMMELTFEGPAGTPLTFTTPVTVLPERKPFTYMLPVIRPRGFLSR
ncbi:MAG: PhoPQ-activated pathogenicity-related family protein [Candidatus Hydrogenedentes bacterium]|nr:PhoPQ-activated pathogenicity-related family protein [Candidatus Hydrogenedentota bacterium]